ncbi:hypothetical protein [Psychrobacter sp. I-STPA10]|uniref:hypothetical protein n=1 Tax=Psychrobacter sp. I-STPA10 TaxID=2585769 RepID=UPI001E3E119F|nr:hypothetical protein [Psychrobacter sp. I-STPA10]
MKAIKLSVVTMAILGTTAAMAAQPAYEYNPEQGIIRNTTGAVVDTTKTLVDTAIHPAAISAEIGTLGYGANLAWGLNESTELQAGWSGMDVDGDIELNAKDSGLNWGEVLGDEYKDFKGTLDYKVKASNPYLGAQLRPFKNWLTVGAGVIVPRDKIDVTLTPTDGNKAKISLNGDEYQVTNKTSVHVHAENKNALAPYATLGFRPNINNRWGMFAEVGAAYMGDYKSNVNVDGTIEINKGTEQNPIYVVANPNEFIEKAEREINDSDLKWYPIAKLGVTYRF